MEQEKIIPEQEKAAMEQRFAQLLADKLNIKSISSIPCVLTDEEEEIPDVRRWL